MKTTITLSGMQACGLAETFAACVHAMVIRLHHRAISRIDGMPGWEVLTPDYYEMRDAIRSIQNPLERTIFIDRVRNHFKNLRKKNGTTPTARSYVARVLENRAGCAARNWGIAA